MGGQHRREKQKQKDQTTCSRDRTRGTVTDDFQVIKDKKGEQNLQIQRVRYGTPKIKKCNKIKNTEKIMLDSRLWSGALGKTTQVTTSNPNDRV